MHANLRDMNQPINTNLRGHLSKNEPLARHVTWRAGGAAQCFYKPADLADLSLFLRGLNTAEPLLFVGMGSNLLVRDGGFAGTVVHLGQSLGGLALDEQNANRVIAGAGVPSPHVAKFAAKNNLVGAEWLAGVPGTVGGALAMNAGCYGTETWEQIVECKTINHRGEIQVRTPADFVTRYRHVEGRSAAQAQEWFVEGSFVFTAGDGEVAKEKIKALLAKRMAAQPLDKPNAGSTFRNPEGDFAARLIESVGLKGFQIGGAQVSLKHANFIVNTGTASATDIEALIAHMAQTVLSKTGVVLVQEVRIVGNSL
jgi:UDP-N-acetylmuramate dehydrogenase